MFPEKLTVDQLVKELPAFYGSEGSLPLSGHLTIESCPKLNQSM
jgi:hypothetical protein